MGMEQLRVLTEQFEWTTAQGVTVTGFNPPKKGVTNVHRKPFFIKYITSKGVVESGVCTCIRVDTTKRMRRVRYEASGQIRWVRDYLVMEVNGIKIVTH